MLFGHNLDRNQKRQPLGAVFFDHIKLLTLVEAGAWGEGWFLRREDKLRFVFHEVLCFSTKAMVEIRGIAFRAIPLTT